MSINESNTTQLVSTKDSNSINKLLTNEGRAIKDVDGDSNQVNYVSIMSTNTKNIAKSKYLVKTGEGFLTSEARLVFSK